MSDHYESEKRTRRRSRTVSWDNSVRSHGASVCFCGKQAQTGDTGVVHLLSPPPPPPPRSKEPTSPGTRDSSVIELLSDDTTMSISRGHSVEKVRFSASRAHSDENDEDYSASVNAILHKRLSVRKGKHQKQRRSSSPVSSMLPDDASLISDRRRSSAFTTTSGDTAINIEDAAISQEQIFENIRLHKEVLGSVRQQPWSIRRKMKLVQQAKEYVKKHEGQLQERLAMSKSTRDILARFHILLVKQWQHSKREMANVISQIIPWELTIKEIESQFGTVVASYFTFLRWLFWVNFVISVLLAAFVVIPEVLITDKEDSSERKTLLPEEMETSRQLMTLLNFEGILQHSPMFYGYYSNRPSSDTGYRLPTAYFITGLVVYIYSFVATLRKMAANSRLSKLSEKDDECIFTWKLFTGWDYMIGNEETAHNRISSIILGFKEALLEEAERMRDKHNWKTVTVRIFANLNMVWMLGSSVYAVILVVGRSTEPEAESTLWRKYEITVVMTLIGTFFPIAFEGLGVLESYHPRTTLRVQLARIMALNLLNLYTLTFALFVKINDMTKDLLELKPINITNVTPSLATVTTLLSTAALLNSTISTTTTSATTTTVSSLVDVLPPICSSEVTECPFMLVTKTIRHDAANVTSPPSPPVTTTTSAPAHEKSTLAKGSSTMCLVDRGTAVGCGADDNGKTTVKEGDWTSVPPLEPKIVNATTEKVMELTISGQVVNYNVTEDLAAGVTVNTAAGISDYESVENWTAATSPAIESTITTDSGNEWTSVTMSPATEWTTTSLETEWTTTSSTTESIVSSTAATESGVDRDTASVQNMASRPTDDVEKDDDRSSDESTIVSDGLRTEEEFASSNNTRTKRLSEIIFNGTHCYRIICLPRLPPPKPNVTDVPMTTQGFTEKPHDIPYNFIGDLYATTTEHDDAPREDLSIHASCLDMNTRRMLRKLCWETMFGQELVKLTVMDLVSTIISTIFVDFARAVFVRYMNRCWCWNLEKRFPQYGDFKIAENILHLVNNQGMVWMGMFFSPGLPIINVVKLMIMMYVRSWAVLTCNVPHDVVFRASRSNNFYLGLLLTMLFLCVLPVGYAIVWIEPSWHCGPFSQYKKIYHIFTNSIKKAVPNPMVHRALDYIASPGIVIPLLLLLILIIYYLASLTSSLREANNDLKTQLRRERTEERRKMFQLVNSKKRGGGGGGGGVAGDGNDDDDYACMDTTLAKWRKIMPDSGNKQPSEGPTFAFGFAEKKLAESDVLDKVREKLVHIEADDQQPADVEKSDNKDNGVQQHPQPPLHHHHHHHHHRQQHLHHHHHLRRPSRNEDPRVTPALRKWKKSKLVASRLPSTESESSDQSEAVPEIRVFKSSMSGEPATPAAVAVASSSSSSATVLTAVAAAKTAAGEPIGAAAVAGVTDHGDGSAGGVDQQPVVRQKARLKLAQILYKEARRRRQKYVEELQNQQE